MSDPIDTQDGECEPKKQAKASDGGGAFPFPVENFAHIHYGISIREYAAVKIMSALVRNSDIVDLDKLARCACNGAQALVDEIERRRHA